MKDIADILNPNKTWYETLSRSLERYNAIYNLPYISNSQKISDSFYNYCLKGKYFVVVALYNSKREFFIQKDFLRDNDNWELVGGWVKEGELFDQALERIVGKETGNILVEAHPIASVKNEYTTSANKNVTHYGLSFLGRVLHDNTTNQNGIFSSDLENVISKTDIEILKLSKKILKTKVVEPPLDEVEHNHNSGLTYLFNKFIVKPITYNFSSKLLFKSINQYIQSSNKDYKRSVLDVACGDDKSILEIARKTKLLVANDIARETMRGLISKADKSNIIFTNHNLLDLDFKIQFDVVICKNVMHHMRSPEEIGKLLEVLGKCGKRVLLMDIENPRQSFLARQWNNYYVKVLKDHGGLFMSAQQFEEIVKISFPKAKIKLDKVKTIKGNYMLAVIDK